MEAKIIIVGLDPKKDKDSLIVLLNESISDLNRLVRFCDQENEMGHAMSERVKSTARRQIKLCERLLKAELVPHPQIAIVQHETHGESEILWN